jgi:regulator of sirC expression with transglutaminase-like and TPR domain
VRRVALALVLLAACGARRGPALAEAPLARRLLGAAVELAPGAHDQDEAASRLEALAARARRALEGRGATSAVDLLDRVVFDEEGYAREVEDADLAYVLLPSVLSARRGSCVGLGTLYLALGELVGVPLRGVVVPGHFFVRAREDGRVRNVELLRRGEEETADWYRARWPLPATTAPVYDRALTDDEVVGVVYYDAGNELRRRGRLAEARRAFERAVALFPSLPEAQASLGAVLQLEGALEPARAAYEAAARLEPDLPGLGRNRALLDEERRSPALEIKRSALSAR